MAADDEESGEGRGELLVEAAKAALPETLAPSIRGQLAHDAVEQFAPHTLQVHTPTALEREQEIRRRLKEQDAHDGARFEEIARTEKEVQEAVNRAEYIAQAIQVRSFQLEPNLPPASKEPLDDAAVAVVEKHKERLKGREGEIGQKREEDLASLDEPLHPMVETRAKLDVVAATGDYQQSLARAGINPRTVELQIEARRAALEAAAQAAQAQADAKSAAAGSPLAQLAIPGQQPAAPPPAAPA